MYQFFDRENAVRFSVITVEKGYGYIIKSKDKTLIKQEVIPAINANKPFCSKRDAKEVARLVVARISNSETPTITIEDLDNLKVAVNCVDLPK